MLPRALDVLALLSALVAAWLWYKASSYHVRRIDKDETLDHKDFNRIVVAMNRTQMLNRRAALATAASALAIALKFADDLVSRW
jgi:hypothetical protein